MARVCVRGQGIYSRLALSLSLSLSLSRALRLGFIIVITLKRPAFEAALRTRPSARAVARGRETS
jgi:hypothetical protein